MDLLEKLDPVANTGSQSLQNLRPKGYDTKQINFRPTVILTPSCMLSMNAKSNTYRKSGNFHVKIIYVLNIHIDSFSWVYGTHENIPT